MILYVRATCICAPGENHYVPLFFRARMHMHFSIAPKSDTPSRRPAEYKLPLLPREPLGGVEQMRDQKTILLTLLSS